MCFYFQPLLIQLPLKCFGAVSPLDHATPPPPPPSPLPPPPCAISHVCKPPPLYLSRDCTLTTPYQLAPRYRGGGVLQCAEHFTGSSPAVLCEFETSVQCGVQCSVQYSAVCSGSVQRAASRWDWRAGPAPGAFLPCCLHSCGAPGETAGPAGVELAGPQPAWPAPGPVLCRSAPSFSTAAGSTDRGTPSLQGH